MSQQDAMVARLRAELAEKTAFQDTLVAGAHEANRDMTGQELELYTRAADRINELAGQIAPLEESMSIAAQTNARAGELEAAYAAARSGQPGATVEYRSAGEYIMDRWNAAIGDRDAMRRMETFERVAAHQTTGDNLGVIPKPIVGGVLNFIDAARPLTAALGVKAGPNTGTFTRPVVTQHTTVAKQAAEKTELASQKMTITSLNVVMETFGGYVNVSRQNIDWSAPSIMDIVVNDLAAQYALTTEGVTAAKLVANAVQGTSQIPAGGAGATAAQVTAAIWAAAGQSYAATKGAGTLVLAVSPDMMAVIGPIFPPVNPTNAQSSGISAGAFSSGPMGSIAGITVVMSAALPAGSLYMTSTAALEVYEQRIGTLQVVEPSVLGVQVAYAGYFGTVVLVAGANIDMTAP